MKFVQAIEDGSGGPTLINVDHIEIVQVYDETARRSPTKPQDAKDDWRSFDIRVTTGTGYSYLVAKELPSRYWLEVTLHKLFGITVTFDEKAERIT